MDTGLFYAVMEADGDLLEPFDAAAAEAEVADEQQGQPPEQPPADMGSDSPPDATDMDELGGFDETGGDMDGGENGDPNDPNQQGQPQQTRNLSQKANDALNQKLYQQFVERNTAIEETLENLQAIIPILPYDVVQKNDLSINRLKTALTHAQDYVLNKFVKAGYGENLWEYQRTDALYTLLQNKINSVLQKFQRDHEDDLKAAAE